MSKIYITPEESTKRIASFFGEINVTGPTNLFEDDEKYAFEIVFFQQPLRVIFYKTYGTIVSQPFNREYIQFASSQNLNRRPKTVEVKPSKIYVTPQELVHGLASVFGAWYVTEPTDVTESEDSIIFNTFWNQQPLKVVLNKEHGIISTQPNNTDFLKYSFNYNQSQKPKV